MHWIIKDRHILLINYLVGIHGFFRKYCIAVSKRLAKILNFFTNFEMESFFGFIYIVMEVFECRIIM